MGAGQANVNYNGVDGDRRSVTLLLKQTLPESDLGSREGTTRREEEKEANASSADL